MAIQAWGPLESPFQGPRPESKYGWNGDGELLLEITDAGRAVRVGETNALDLIGYDAWVFGVHVDASGELWCDRDGEVVRVR